MNEQEFFKEKTEINIFVQILQKYLPFWPLFALTIPISLSVAYIYFRSQVPIYVATAKVLLKDPNKGGGDSKVHRHAVSLGRALTLDWSSELGCSAHCRARGR